MCIFEVHKPQGHVSRGIALYIINYQALFRQTQLPKTLGPAEPNKSPVFFTPALHISIKLAPTSRTMPLHLRRSVWSDNIKHGKTDRPLQALTAFNHDFRTVGKIRERWRFFFPSIVCRKIHVISLILFSKECILCMVLHLFMILFLKSYWSQPIFKPFHRACEVSSRHKAE